MISVADETAREATFAASNRPRVPLPRDWEPWFRLLGQLFAHRAWETFSEALGRGLEALTGARSVALLFAEADKPLEAQALVGSAPPLPLNLPQEPGEVVQERSLTSVMLVADGPGTMWLLLEDPGRIDLEDCLPAVATTLGLAIQRVRSFAAIRARTSETLAQAAEVAKAGASRQAVVAMALEALEYAGSGTLGVVFVRDGGRIEVYSRQDGAPRGVPVEDPLLQAALQPASEEQRELSLRGQMARSLALTLRRGDAPTSFYHVAPLSGAGEVAFLVGLGIADSALEPSVGAPPHDLAGFPRVRRATLSQLEVLSQVRLVARELSTLLANALAAERGFMEGMTRESTHLGIDLHDSVLQDVAYVQLQLGRLEQELPEDSDTSRAIVHEIHGALSTVGRELRELSIGLTTSRPSQDLVEAITPYIERFRSRFDGDVRMRVRGTKRGLPPAVSGQTARVAQELLNNVWKHADATHANVEVSYAADYLELVVQDDGRGFEQTERSTSQLGLRGVEQRIDELGGTLTIESEPGKGTAIRVRIPS